MKQEIKKYIEEVLLSGRGGDGLGESDDLLSSGTIDSLGVIQLVSFVEENFEIKVPPQDMVIENFVSIDAIHAYLERRLGEES